MSKIYRNYEENTHYPTLEGPGLFKAQVPTTPPTNSPQEHFSQNECAHYSHVGCSSHTCLPEAPDRVLSKASLSFTSSSSKNARPLPKKRSGHWTPEERRLYLEFIDMHRHNFQRKELRRLEKIFKLMSEHIGSRLADQCRSHHQKMEKKYKTLDRILLHEREHPLPISSKQDQPATCPTLPKTTPTKSEEDILLHFDHQDEVVMPDPEQDLKNRKLSIERSPQRALSSQDMEIYSVHSYQDQLDVFGHHD